MSRYQQQTAWQDIQTFLPTYMQLKGDRLPQEEDWPWQGHVIHLDRYERPQAPVKLILLHGVGTNGRQMSMLLGSPLAQRGYAVVAPDLPGYGVSSSKPGAQVRYDDWVQLVVDLIAAEIARDGKPVVLYGLSAGGMLAYHAAAIERRVAGIVGMAFLDQRDQIVRDACASHWLVSRIGGPLASLLAHTPLAGLKLPMWLLSNMHALVNNRPALRAFLDDPTSAGNWASLRFLHRYLNYQPAIAPEDFDVCPILLTQPACDNWTPLELSQRFLRRIGKVAVDVTLLDNAGHYPLEQPGIQQLHERIACFLQWLLPESPAVTAPCAATHCC